ncbi:tRNA (guanosine(37)-N1)-methyltransferase TrmD [Sandaracinomonas limnophila]|uniref:tRNA (guanine-N(1)-)-methyltransferase n=1 Tax=Sandaracinomonas limnophila TaxID=1862386 RepID=A0A437PXZ7_9BACT|nr:tRNA (guanosine(37)-N1)-methyltransferase TrmD [Sandaracinomonas limnophila]RVU27088.1 tRNA (guanosine(37)-N1)-methyltransferase TrmD [Sandaracinomonas limnophila]
MRIDIISVIPDLMKSFFEHSICKRAQKNNLVEIHLHDLHDFSSKKHRQVDDYPFGGGAGMVLSPEPLSKAIESLQADRLYDEVIFFSPDGQTLQQNIVNGLANKTNMIFICGHYKGIDERIREKYVTQEISIGDYVLSGGELAAAVTADAIVRLIPGAIGDETSALTDSFQDGLLSAPVYTRPANFEGMEVPAVLLSGHDKKISEWRFEQSLSRTKQRRPDLLTNE